MNHKEILGQVVYRLLSKDPFLGTLMQQLPIKRMPSIMSDQGAIACLTFKKEVGKFEMWLGERWYGEEFDIASKSSILEHELMHLSHGHVFDSIRHGDDKETAFIRNIAQDMTINQYLNPKINGGVDVNKWKTRDGQPYPLFRTSHEYFVLIQEELEEHKKNKNGGQGNTKERVDSCSRFDNHDWDSLDEATKEKMLADGLAILKRSIEKTSTDHSKMPQSIKDLLEWIETATAGLNYKGILRAAFKRSLMSSERQYTWKRPSKRYGVFSPGSKPEELPQVIFYNDSSGSISIQEQNTYLRIMDGFLQAGSKQCTLAFWHTSLYYKNKYKKGQEIDSGALQSGGTDPQCVLDDIAQHNYDLAIILTDGCYEQCVYKGTSQVVWIISEEGNLDHPMKHVGITVPLKGLL